MVGNMDKSKGDENFSVVLDKDYLSTEGKELIRKLLIILQTYKSTGSAEKAKEFYEKYSVVNEFFLKVRKLMLKSMADNVIQINNNIEKHSEKRLESKSYPESFEGCILSFADRYPWSQ